MVEDALERIKKLAEHWFLYEPLFFNVYCTHKLEENTKLHIPFRTGKMRIEYNPQIIDELSDSGLEEYLKVEIYRILLKHPYQRVPIEPNMSALGLSSDMTIADSCDVKVKMPKPSMYGLQDNLSLEEYYADLKYIVATPQNGQETEDKNQLQQGGQSNSEGNSEDAQQDMEQVSREDQQQQGGPQQDGQGNSESDIENSEQNDSLQQQKGQSNSDNNSKDSTGNSPQKSSYSNTLGKNSLDKLDTQQYKELSELWEENEEACQKVNNEIENAERNNLWGSVTGGCQKKIKASLVIKMDYRRILESFRATVLSSNRVLTRLRPNRRYDFDYMGSKYGFTTKILVAVDTSGSINTRDLSNFFSIINRFFKYGIKEIDVIQFDCDLTVKKPVKMKKFTLEHNIFGRGGTSFQPPVDYYCNHPEYDGLIVFTDGYAWPPKFSRPAKSLWIFCEESCYKEAQRWIKGIPLAKSTWIPTAKKM